MNMQELVNSIEQSEAIIRKLLVDISEQTVEPVRESLLNQARRAVEMQPGVAAKIEDLTAFKSRVGEASTTCAEAVAKWIRSMTIADLEQSKPWGEIYFIPDSEAAPKLFSAFSEVMSQELFDAGDGLGTPSRYWTGSREWHFYVNHQTGRTSRPDYARPDVTEFNKEFENLRELKRELKEAQATASREAQLSRWDEA